MSIVHQLQQIIKNFFVPSQFSILFIERRKKAEDERIVIGHINVIVLAYLNIHTWTTNVQ
jgi:hypothetical protein